MSRVDRPFWSMILLIAFNFGLMPYGVATARAQGDEELPPLEYCMPDSDSVGATINNGQWSYDSFRKKWDYTFDLVITIGCDEGNDASGCWVCVKVKAYRATCICTPWTTMDPCDPWTEHATWSFETPLGECETSVLRIRQETLLNIPADNFLRIDVEITEPDDETGCDPGNWMVDDYSHLTSTPTGGGGGPYYDDCP